MYILGINSVYHETSACLLCDGQLLAAAEEERFTGVRHGKEPTPYGAWLLPFHATNYCLEKATVTINELEYVAYSFQPTKRLAANVARIVTGLLRADAKPLRRELAYWYFNRRAPSVLAEEAPREKRFRKRFLVAGKTNWKVCFVEHHLAHAASAFFTIRF